MYAYAQRLLISAFSAVCRMNTIHRNTMFFSGLTRGAISRQRRQGVIPSFFFSFPMGGSYDAGYGQEIFLHPIRD